MVTYPNQKIIKIDKLKRQKGQKNNPFSIVNVKACNAANYILKPGAFRLYMYLMMNQDGYRLALSPSAIREAIGMSETQYRAALKELKYYGYMNSKPCNGEHSMYEMPFNEPHTLEKTLCQAHREKQKESAERSVKEKAKREKAKEFNKDTPPVTVDDASPCIEIPIHEESDTDQPDSENPIQLAPKTDTACTGNEVYTVPETGYRNSKNNTNNKKHNIRDYYGEQSEASDYPTGNESEEMEDYLEDIYIVIDGKMVPMMPDESTSDELPF